VRCIELGATDYLTKPFNPVLLKARIDNCIEKSRYRAQAAAYLERIEGERRRADELLATVLPRSIVRALKRDAGLAPQRYEDVAVLFCDVVGFTAYSENNPPETVFAELEMLIDRFEAIAAKHGLDKIKTIGDAFMATANLLLPRLPARLIWSRRRRRCAPIGRCGPASTSGRSPPGSWAKRNSSSTYGATR
jgi:adenylate cyclase